MYLPFICLGLGMLIGFSSFSRRYTKQVDQLVNSGLILLMLVLGAQIGSDQVILNNLPTLGLKSFLTALLAVGSSVLLTLAVEKSVLPLAELGSLLGKSGNLAVSDITPAASEQGISPLVWLMPGGIFLGIILGKYILPQMILVRLDILLTLSLIVLYIGVGIGFGSNRQVFYYLRWLGLKIIWLVGAITMGSITAGFAAAIILGIPFNIAVTSAGGMSYYSLTGATLTTFLGPEAGTYGFLVNVFREVITVITLPVLVRISPGSAIAAGAAGTMDTMLAPVTKFVGMELGMVALVSGTVLTLLVPFILPLLVTL